MTVRPDFGIAEPDKGTFARQRRNRRRCLAVATGTAAALSLTDDASRRMARVRVAATGAQPARRSREQLHHAGGDR
ncbi:hypothetical protein [Streptomyces sp. PT19]|uniref:hypothetical protein n=1 Tax=Streptomyces sp. PT19 TaxID=3452239 RepID=UPI003F7DC260